MNLYHIGDCGIIFINNRDGWVMGHLVLIIAMMAQISSTEREKLVGNKIAAVLAYQDCVIAAALDRSDVDIEPEDAGQSSSLFCRDQEEAARDAMISFEEAVTFKGAIRLADGRFAVLEDRITKRAMLCIQATRAKFVSYTKSHCTPAAFRTPKALSVLVSDY